MIWLRKGVVYLLSVLLLTTLLGAAFSTGFNQTVGQPQKVEAYLAESKIYDHFVVYVADQAKESEGDSSGTVSLSDVAVQAAAKSSFPADLIQKNVNTFLEANYAWLEGKTATPDFKIDLTKEKIEFAKRVGWIVETYTSTLPICTNAQAAQEKGVDPLAATCRPKGIKPADVGASTTKQLSGTSDFLGNPVITPSSVNPNGDKQNGPYYDKLSRLPAAYQISGKLPYIFGGLSTLFAAGIVFIALTRRKGVRRLGVVLATAGAILVAVKFIADFALDKAEAHVFNQASVGQLQRSLTDFVHRVESSMVRIDLWFGIGFILAALIILAALLRTRQKPDKKIDTKEPTKPEEPAGKLPLLKAKKRLMRPFGDSIMPLGARPGGEEAEGTPGESSSSEPSDTPKRRKRPRLIQ